MPIRVEIYGAEGVAIAIVTRDGSLREIVEENRELKVEQAMWHPLDGSPARQVGDLSLAPDDIHIAVGESREDGPVHAQWHDVTVDLGPYHVTGQMPTMPGFDPGRALARPTGEFVLLRDVQIALLGNEAAGAVSQPTALINRYVVDRVEADMMLGFFFPGAEMVLTGGRDTLAAGAGHAAAAAVTAAEGTQPAPPVDAPSAAASQPTAPGVA